MLNDESLDVKPMISIIVEVVFHDKVNRFWVYIRSSNSHRNPSSTEIVVRLWKTRKKLEFVNFYRNIYVPRNRPF